MDKIKSSDSVFDRSKVEISSSTIITCNLELDELLQFISNFKFFTGESLETNKNLNVEASNEYSGLLDRLDLIKVSYEKVLEFISKTYRREDRNTLSKFSENTYAPYSRLEYFLGNRRESLFNLSSNSYFVSFSKATENISSTLLNKTILSSVKDLNLNFKLMLASLPNFNKPSLSISQVRSVMQELLSEVVDDKHETAKQMFNQGNLEYVREMRPDNIANIAADSNEKYEYYGKIETNNPLFPTYLAIYQTEIIIGTAGQSVNAGRFIRKIAREENRTDILELFNRSVEYPFLQDLGHRSEDETDVTFPIYDNSIELPIPFNHNVIALEFQTKNKEPRSPYSLKESPLGEIKIVVPSGAIRLKVRYKKATSNNTIPKNLYDFLIQIMPAFPVNHLPKERQLINAALKEKNLELRAKNLVSAFSAFHPTYSDNKSFSNLVRGVGDNKLSLFWGALGGTCYTLAYQLTNLFNLAQIPTLLVTGIFGNQGKKRYVFSPTHCNLKYLLPNGDGLVDATRYTDSMSSFSTDTLSKIVVSKKKAELKDCSPRDAVLGGRILREEILKGDRKIATHLPYLYIIPNRFDSFLSSHDNDFQARLARFELLSSSQSLIDPSSSFADSTIQFMNFLHQALSEVQDTGSTDLLSKFTKLVISSLDTEKGKTLFTDEFIDFLIKSLNSIVIDKEVSHIEIDTLISSVVSAITPFGESAVLNSSTIGFLDPIVEWLRSLESRSELSKEFQFMRDNFERLVSNSFSNSDILDESSNVCRKYLKIAKDKSVLTLEGRMSRDASEINFHSTLVKQKQSQSNLTNPQLNLLIGELRDSIRTSLIERGGSIADIYISSNLIQNQETKDDLELLYTSAYDSGTFIPIEAALALKDLNINTLEKRIKNETDLRTEISFRILQLLRIGNFASVITLLHGWKVCSKLSIDLSEHRREIKEIVRKQSFDNVKSNLPSNNNPISCLAIRINYDFCSQIEDLISALVNSNGLDYEDLIDIWPSFSEEEVGIHLCKRFQELNLKDDDYVDLSILSNWYERNFGIDTYTAILLNDEELVKGEPELKPYVIACRYIVKKEGLKHPLEIWKNNYSSYQTFHGIFMSSLFGLHTDRDDHLEIPQDFLLSRYPNLEYYAHLVRLGELEIGIKKLREENTDYQSAIEEGEQVFYILEQSISFLDNGDLHPSFSNLDLSDTSLSQLSTEDLIIGTVEAHNPYDGDFDRKDNYHNIDNYNRNSFLCCLEEEAIDFFDSNHNPYKLKLNESLADEAKKRLFSFNRFHRARKIEVEKLNKESDRIIDKIQKRKQKHSNQSVNGLSSGLSGRAKIARTKTEDFAELGGYTIGDDIRSIDWRASLRSQKTYVRKYQQGGELKRISYHVDLECIKTYINQMKIPLEVLFENIASDLMNSKKVSINFFFRGTNIYSIPYPELKDAFKPKNLDGEIYNVGSYLLLKLWEIADDVARVVSSENKKIDYPPSSICGHSPLMEKSGTKVNLFVSTNHISPTIALYRNIYSGKSNSILDIYGPF